MKARTFPDASPAAPAPLQIAGLTVAYSGVRGRVVALRKVSLALHAGQLLGLIGPNGCGKTTLIRAVTGAVRPDAGRVVLQGRDVQTLAQRQIARCAAVVPQEPVLPDGFSALECVLMGRTPHLRLLQNEGAHDMGAARRAMELTDTWELAGRPVGELSGGERQRVVIARALAQETAVLLLDEPTTHLDIGHQAAVLELMRALCRDEGKAVLAVAHDLTLAAQYCDRLVMLRAGEVVAEGKPQDVITQERVQQVYGARVDVIAHPETGRPVVAPSAPGG